MTRLGFNSEEAIEKITYIKTNFKNLKIKGIYTHLSSADSDIEYTKYQLQTFDKIINSLKDININPEYIHALNSAGSIYLKDYNYTHVRCGISLYGYYPDNTFKNKIELKPVLKLTAPVINIRTLNKDSNISYNKTHLGKKGSKIATIQIGYADGLKRNLSNKYYVSVNGVKCKILGNICMDMCMINVTNIKNINLGDEVTIFETDEDIDTIATINNTINYEIIATISNRVKRIYID
jgi:alanine racemase